VPLKLHAEAASPAAPPADPTPTAEAPPPRPLLLAIGDLAALVARSVPSLRRDDAAGRLPAAVRLGGSKRWRRSDIDLWVALGCPSRAEFEARKKCS
jgi:predicted DNA-binding transcriptional regulator AlpA